MDGELYNPPDVKVRDYARCTESTQSIPLKSAGAWDCSILKHSPRIAARTDSPRAHCHRQTLWWLAAIAATSKLPPPWRQPAAPRSAPPSPTPDPPQVFKPFFMRAAGGWPGAARMPQLAELGADFDAAGEASPAPRVYPGIPASAAYICKGGDCRYYLDS